MSQPPLFNSPPSYITFISGHFITQITDDGCAHLASRLRSGALPAAERPYFLCGVYGIPASEVATEAVNEARPELAPVA